MNIDNDEYREKLYELFSEFSVDVPGVGEDVGLFDFSTTKVLDKHGHPTEFAIYFTDEILKLLAAQRRALRDEVEKAIGEDEPVPAIEALRIPGDTMATGIRNGLRAEQRSRLQANLQDGGKDGDSK